MHMCLYPNMYTSIRKYKDFFAALMAGGSSRWKAGRDRYFQLRGSESHKVSLYIMSASPLL